MLTNQYKPIKKLSYLVRIVVGIVMGTVLALLLFTGMHSFQRWTAGRVADVLSAELDTHVEIGRLRIDLPNRVVLDDILLLDQHADTMLRAARLSTKVDILALAKQRIRLSNIQLFGYDIHLRRHAADEPYNFQFVIDKFASADTTQHTPLDLAINNIVVRRGDISHELMWMPARGGIDPSHLHLHDISLRASVNTLTDDSINVQVNKLSLQESSSGLTLRDMHFALAAGRRQATFNDLIIRLNNSDFSIPQLIASYDAPAAGKPVSEWLSSLRAQASADATVVPADLSPLLQQLKPLDMPVKLHTEAHISNNILSLNNTALSAEALAMDAEAQLHIGTSPAIEADVHRLFVGSSMVTAVIEALNADADKPLLAPAPSTILQRLGNIEATGHATYNKALAQTQLSLRTNAGNATVDATLTNSDILEAHLTTEDIRLHDMLADVADIKVDNVNLEAQALASLRQGTIQAQATANALTLAGHNIDAINIDANVSPTSVEADINVEDNEIGFSLLTNLKDETGIRLSPDALMRLQGYVVLSKLRIDSEDHHLRLNDLTLHNYVDDAGQHLEVSGDFIDAHADGHFSPTTLAASGQQLLHAALPALIPAPSAASPATEPQDDITFAIQIWNTDPLLALTDVDLRLPEPGSIRGELHGPQHMMDLRADFDHVDYGSEQLHNVHFVASQQQDSLSLWLEGQRMMSSGPVDIGLQARASDNRLHTQLTWDTRRRPAMQGTLDVATLFSRDEANALLAHIDVNPTQLTVADTVWNIHPAVVEVHDGGLDVHGFEVAEAGRHLRVNGRAGRQPTDTLYAHLKDINLQYVFGIINFHDVEFAGLATGDVAAHNLMSSPVVDADLRVPQVYLNDGLLGDLHMLGGWGRRGPRSIDLDGWVTEPERHLLTHVEGIVTPGHRPESGIDLNIFAANTNIYFVNFFTKSIFQDLQGRASGYARLFGQFGQLDIEGDLRVDTAALSLGVLGTRYTVAGDSLHLRPGRFYFNNARARDMHYGSDGRDHYGELTGEVRHRHFKDITYDFRVTAHDVLGYDFRDFGDQSFYGTVFANGNVHVYGGPGHLNCDISGHPTAGTIFTYNASSPDAITDNGFITFKKRNPHDSPIPDTSRKGGELSSENMGDSAQPLPSLTGEAESAGSDMRINFDLDIGPEATMRLLMDARSEDYITLAGDGHIRANYHNRGAFQMYGTYRVDHGTYRLSLQDVIRKDFQFEQGSTITFGGAPMKGDLRLKAVYTVPSVSLNDLAAGTNFSNSTVRVNCIMNITGQAERPQISFDFDIPNVNEDEKQMVRSLISTDEERNMQIIYLLGIGRFYTYGLGAEQDQTSMAMNSLLSSTLSGQLNELLTSAIGNAASNWNFGTNLSTGNMGWSSVDVEGMLSGRLLNNRLLINGTFGYRDTPVANTNFIGDFDVQWLLTPSGNIRLKAYSETNDRYFTKSALTTQGIGIQLRKDFNAMRDLFRRNRR